MHGVREELLEQQAKAIGIPLWKMEVPNVPENAIYETCLHTTLNELRTQGISHIIFGDIFLEDLKEYRLALLKKHDLAGVFPLWKRSTKVLINRFINLKFKTITCCIDTGSLREDWVGKEIDLEFVNSLPKKVDPCGEQGEFHTFCFDGPIFKQPVVFSLGEKRFVPLQIKTLNDEQNSGFLYVDLIPS
jgi:uncharacterized protein (TIGR00290 family)